MLVIGGDRSRVENKEEVDGWLFEHSVVMGHTCYGVKDESCKNKLFIDSVTGEEVKLVYGE